MGPIKSPIKGTFQPPIFAVRLKGFCTKFLTGNLFFIGPPQVSFRLDYKNWTSIDLFFRSAALFRCIVFQGRFSVAIIYVLIGLCITKFINAGIDVISLRSDYSHAIAFKSVYVRAFKSPPI